MNTFQKAIKASGMPVRAIANNSGMTRQAIYNIINGKAMPSFKGMVRLATALGIKTEDFFNLESYNLK